jgi:organic radical activating enzyme
MVFTGGEPMLPRTQPGMVAILKEFERRNNLPDYVTIETNGTKPITPELSDFIKNYLGEWFWSISPKLWSTAGEPVKRAIKPEVIAEYSKLSSRGQLKFVVNGSKESWQEVEEHTTAFRKAGCNFPVWIMGVGGTFEGLVQTEETIADEAIQRGYNYTSRVHVHIYGNKIGK